MFARLSRSSKAVLRLFMTIMGCPKAFKYIICSESSMVSHGVGKKKRIALTELLLALALKHPALILELKGIPKNRKTFWARGNFTPRASYIVSYQDNDESRS
jgi:hypothetical protein